jgi:hypothetical protein
MPESAETGSVKVSWENSHGMSATFPYAQSLEDLALPGAAVHRMNDFCGLQTVNYCSFRARRI